MPEDSDKLFRELQSEFLVHELKNPVSIIETGIRSLLEKKAKIGPLSDRQEKVLKRTLRNSKKIRKMLDDLLEIGRSEAGYFEWSTFKPSSILLDLLHDVLETLPGFTAEELTQCQADKEITLLADYGIHLNILPNADGIELFQDKTKFIQIVGNLIQNALQYRKEWVEIKLTAKDTGISLQVSDDGPGLDPHQQEAVFQRYNRLQETNGLSRRGHGIGLTGARMMARYMGGDIEVSGGKGKGAVFNLFLPTKNERNTE